MNTENVRRQMPRWLVIAERSLYAALLMASLATTIYWTSRNFSGPQESGTDRLRADTLETAPRSAAKGGFAGESDATAQKLLSRPGVVARCQHALQPRKFRPAPAFVGPGGDGLRLI